MEASPSAGRVCAVVLFPRAHLAQMAALVVLDRVKRFIDSQSAVVALFVHAVVDGLVHSDSTPRDAVVHVLVAFVQRLLAAAYAGLDLARPGALSAQQLLDLVVGRTCATGGHLKWTVLEPEQSITYRSPG